MDSGQTVFLSNTLRQEDGVLEVVTIPRHEGDAEVLTQSQFTQVHRRTIRHYVATLYRVTSTNQWTLVNTGVLVRAGVLGQVVDIYTCFTGKGFFVVNFYNHTRCIDRIDHTAALSNHTYTGVLRYRTLNTGTYQRLLGFECRNRLTLHVRSHQCTVSIIVLKERDK